MSGTGFLDGFKEKKGNFEPETKDKKKATTPKKAEPKQAKIIEEPVVEGSQEPPKKVEEPVKAEAKKEVKAKPKKEVKPVVVAGGIPQTLPNANPAIQRMIASARAPVPTTNYVLCGVAGPFGCTGHCCP